MTQRALLGRFTRTPIAVVREHGSRVECTGLVPWLVPQLHEFLVNYWSGECAPGRQPEQIILEALQ